MWGSLIRKIAVSIIKINWEYVYMGVEEFFKQEEERFIRDNLMSDEVLDFIRENTLPFNQLMAYYRCAIMEVETKFKVLNEQFSLQYDRNPIESIKTRIKSTEGIIKKANKKKSSIYYAGNRRKYKRYSRYKSYLFIFRGYIYACGLSA